MSVGKIIIVVIIILYNALNCFSVQKSKAEGITAWKKALYYSALLFGILSLPAFLFDKEVLGILLLALDLLTISACAYHNGFVLKKKPNYSHHAVRLVIHLGLLAGVWFL
ncbi:MAG: hypothetical protein K6F51_05925 [Acetatifactor sp.]|nr:hypothetical protein [Acetatifactor sp.]